jgi:hypothetical protein
VCERERELITGHIHISMPYAEGGRGGGAREREKERERGERDLSAGAIRPSMFGTVGITRNVTARRSLIVVKSKVLFVQLHPLAPFCAVCM